MPLSRISSAKPTRRTRLTWTIISLVTGLAVIGIGVTAAATWSPPLWDQTSIDRQLLRGDFTDWYRAERGSTTTRSPAIAAVPDDVLQQPDIVPEPTQAPVATPTPAPTTVAGTATGPTPTPPSSSGGSGRIAGADPRVGGDYILVSRARLVSLPMSGAAWGQLEDVANGKAGSPDLSNMDQENNVRVLAQALVFARTGEAKYRASVLANLKAVIGTEGSTTLALGREAAAYALAADFIGLAQVDAKFDSGVFRPWLRSLLTKSIEDRTLRSTHEDRANNWGTHAGASRAAIAAYLGDGAELARTAQVFQGWLGDRKAYAGFDFGDLSWQPKPSAPVAVLPVGASLGGHPVGGALPEEMRRGADFKWPPAGTDYPWGALEGAVLQAEILHRSGFDAYNWSDGALLRAVQFLFDDAGWRPAGNDQWVFWVIDYRYGTSYRAGAPISPGKNFGWTDWLYGPGG